MRKKLFIFLSLLLISALASCKENGSAEMPEGSITYSYTGYQEMSPLESFSYGDDSESYKNILRKKQVYNLEAIREDILENEELGQTSIDEITLDENIFGSRKRYEDNTYIHEVENGYQADMKVIYLSGVKEILWSNPSRYYTEDFLKDLSRLESDEITASELTELYGDTVMNSFIRTRVYEIRISVSYGSDSLLKENAELMERYFASGPSALTLKEYTKVSGLKDKYDITISLDSTDSLPDYDSYMRHLENPGNGDEKFLYLPSGDCGGYVLPDGYSHAEELLGSRFDY